VDVLATIGAALSAAQSAKTALDLVKAAMAAKANVKDAEANSLLADLYNRLAEMTIQLADVRIEAAKLVDENARLKAALEKERSDVPEVEFRYGVYWKPGDNVPFCQTCYDKNKRLMRLQERWIFDGVSMWKCTVCNNSFNKPE
jgi:hypothetical protein